MTGKLNKFWKWTLALALVMIILIVLDIAVLAIPGPFFPEKKQYGSITVFSDKPIGPETDSILSEVFLRLHAVPIFDSEKKYNLCLCSTREKFTFFSRLTVRSNRIMGFSLLGSAYVNIDFINELGMKTGGQPRYLTREGSIVHVATHELMHAYLTDACGSFVARTLPEWKTEGYCEYGVNQFVAPRDSGYTIQERIDIYQDDARWNPVAEVHRPHYAWGLMMEYMMNVRGLNLKQVMDESITYENTYREMMNWRKSIRNNNRN